MITLRDYQEEIIEKARSAFRSGKKAPILVLPTGAGKTICFSYMSSEAVKRGGKVMILVHRQELVYQTAEKLDFFGLEYGIISPDFPHTDSPVQIAMINTLTRRLIKTEKPTLLVIDEAHHSCAKNYKKIIDWAECLTLGVTATPCRLDGKGLGNIFDHIAIGVTVQNLIDRGYLSKYKYFGFPYTKREDSTKELQKLKISMGDYAPESRDKVYRIVIGDVVGQWEEKSRKQPTIVFCSTVEHAKSTALLFQEKGYNFQPIDGKMDKTYRKSIISGLADGTIQGVTSCDVISEGTDIPVAGCAILLRKTASTSLFLQQVGRVLRPVEGKTAIIIDMVGNYEEHGGPSDEREWCLEYGVKKEKEKEKKEPSIQCEECYCVFEKYDEDGDAVEECPECGWKVPQKKRVQPKVDKAITYLEIDFNTIKNKKVFNGLFSEYSNIKGWKKGRAYHQQKKWSELGKTPLEASIEDFQRVFSESDKEFFGGDVVKFMNSQRKLFREFKEWQNQRA